MKTHWKTMIAVFLVLLLLGQAETMQDQTGEALAQKSGCYECHTIDKGTNKDAVGPSFNDISERYKGNRQASDSLVLTLKNGGKGNWTAISHGVPMPPYGGRLTDTEIRTLVSWVLGLGQSVPDRDR